MGRLPKRLRELEREFPTWEVSITRGGHIRLKSANTGKTLFTSRTPSDWRTDKNFAAQVRRAEKSV